MSSLSTERVQKVVTFSPQLYSTAHAKTKKLGVPFAEYVRHLVMKDIEEDVSALPMVDLETEARIGQSLKDLEEGRYITVDPTNEDQMDRLVGLR